RCVSGSESPIYLTWLRDPPMKRSGTLKTRNSLQRLVNTSTSAATQALQQPKGEASLLSVDLVSPHSGGHSNTLSMSQPGRSGTNSTVTVAHGRGVIQQRILPRYTPCVSLILSHRADVAELADALGSGLSSRKGVEVQVLSSAPNPSVL